MTRHTRLAGFVTLALAGSLLAACGGTVVTPTPRPTAPEGWVTVVSDGRDLRLTLPLWLIASDTQYAIFANEPPHADQTFMELMAEGPGAELQPGPQDRLEDWLAARIAPAGPGVRTISSLILPAGPAVRFEQVIPGGTARDWRFAAYAIRTRIGVGYLLIDGPVALWAGREADAALIPFLLELGPGR